MSQRDLIQIVDENDQPVGGASKQEAHAQGLIHRIAQVIVEDTNGRLLLQRRSAQVMLYPGYWDASVGGHVDEGEEYDAAAKREMQEEIGLQNVELQQLGYYRKDKLSAGRELKRFYKVFKVAVPADTDFRIEPAEVAEVRWFTPAEAKRLTEDPSQASTHGLKEILNRFYS